MQHTFPFTIEAGQVQTFHRAIGSPENELAGNTAPLTDIMAADHFDPEFGRRPKYGEPWLDTPLESFFHVEQTIDYHAPHEIGMQLTAIRRPGRRWEKLGRNAGKLNFIETLTELVDAKNNILVTSSWVDVLTQNSHLSLTQKQPGSPKN